MHESLTQAFIIVVPRIMPGCMMGKQREHATVPVPHSDPGFAMGLVLNVKAPAGGTHIGAGAAVDTGKGFFLPEWRFIEIQQDLVLELISADGGSDAGFGCCF